MRARFLTFGLLVLTVLKGVAQELLVNPHELTYRSEFEEKVLTRFFKEKDADGFDLMMAGGSLLTESKLTQARKTFYDHVATYKQDKIASRKNEKKARFIYDDIHKTFLKKYSDQGTFEEIFYNGNYNSFSATAMYALVFREIGVPFTVKEEPSGAFVIAYPDAEKVKIEATSPGFGITLMDNAFKQSFVNALKQQKIISGQEAVSRSDDELFDKYYFGDNPDISLANLAGIQYMNDGVTLTEQQKFQEAHASFEKAYLLYPGQRTSYMLLASGSSALQARKEKDSLHAVLVGKLSRFRDLGVTNDMIVGEFAMALNNLLFEKGKKKDAETYYRILARMIGNEILLDEIKFVYAFECARLAYNQARYRESAELFEAALSVKPQHLETANALVGALAMTFQGTADNVANLNRLTDLDTKYPSLQENNNFNNLLASLYLLQSSYEYEREKAPEGDKYRMLFEQRMKKFPDIPVNVLLVGHAYSRSAIYYFRKGQTAKAKAILDSGLQLAPNSQELLTRKQMIR